MRGVPARGTRVGITGLAAIIRSRTAHTNNDDSESAKRRTDDSAKPLLVRAINARVISRSVTALIGGAPNPVGTKRGSAASASISCFVIDLVPPACKIAGLPVTPSRALAHSFAFLRDSTLDGPNKQSRAVSRPYMRTRLSARRDWTAPGMIGDDWRSG